MSDSLSEAGYVYTRSSRQLFAPGLPGPRAIALPRLLQLIIFHAMYKDSGGGGDDVK